jgi:hypothetical protein
LISSSTTNTRSKKRFVEQVIVTYASQKKFEEQKLEKKKAKQLENESQDNQQENKPEASEQTSQKSKKKEGKKEIELDPETPIPIMKRSKAAFHWVIAELSYGIEKRQKRVIQNSDKVIQYLISVGADTAVKNGRGEAPIHMFLERVSILLFQQ